MKRALLNHVHLSRSERYKLDDGSQDCDTSIVSNDSSACKVKINSSLHLISNIISPCVVDDDNNIPFVSNKCSPHLTTLIGLECKSVDGEENKLQRADIEDLFGTNGRGNCEQLTAASDGTVRKEPESRTEPHSPQIRLGKPNNENKTKYKTVDGVSSPVLELLVPHGGGARATRSHMDTEASIEQSIARHKQSLQRINTHGTDADQEGKLAGMALEPDQAMSNQLELSAWAGHKNFDVAPRSVRTAYGFNLDDNENASEAIDQGPPEQLSSFNIETLPQRTHTCEQKVVSIADELGISSLLFLRVVRMYLNRVVKYSNVSEAPLTTVEQTLEETLQFVWKNKNELIPNDSIWQRPGLTVGPQSKKSNAPSPPPLPPLPPLSGAPGEPGAQKAVERINSPTAPGTSLRRLFPLQLGPDVTPPPPAAFQRPPGRARTTSMLFADIVSFLCGPDIVAMSGTCRGLQAYSVTNKAVLRMWPLLIQYRFGVSSIDRNVGKSDYARLWNSRKGTCVLLCGALDSDRMANLLHDGITKTFHTMVVDLHVPCNVGDDVSAAQAIFCAAKACSPCVIHIRDSKLLEHDDYDENSVVSEHEAVIASGSADGHRRRLTRAEVVQLCKLVQQDLSSDAVVVLCHAANPWKVPRTLQSLLRRIELNCGTATSTGGGARFYVNDGEQTNDDKINEKGTLAVPTLVSKITQVAPELRPHVTEAIAKNALPLLQSIKLAELTRRLLDGAAAKMLTRLRQAKYFAFVQGKYQVCRADHSGAHKVERLSDLPVTSVKYGPYHADDFFSAIELLSLTRPWIHEHR